MTIARLTVERGQLTEFPLAEKVKGGWQNGVMFYPDTDVTAVQELEVQPLVTEEQIVDAVVGYAYDRAFKVHGKCIDLDELTDMGQAVARALGRGSEENR